ncbi:hypothetical protein HanPSC8_Chr14g0629761 [Helianthus annuus]|nr:hypothetical protein HanIR_Chr14g0712621 [Helianthus annuus]KAJ0841381.1 hypothetical protein HanPSC8_Chr14g0629761 [Helianthus annuus]
MFHERFSEIYCLILVFFWVYNMKHWRFKQFWGFQKLGFVLLVPSVLLLVFLWRFQEFCGFEKLRFMLRVNISSSNCISGTRYRSFCNSFGTKVDPFCSIRNSCFVLYLYWCEVSKLLGMEVYVSIIWLYTFVENLTQA